jgi:hypothetical protein
MSTGVSGIEAQQSAGARQTGGSPAEGIGVHGYWKIDVRNRDGSLASHTEFENALTGEGQSSLVNALLGANAFGPLFIRLSGSPQPCIAFDKITQTTIPSVCFIANANLTSAVQQNPSGALMLTGSTTAGNNGVIDTVSTVTILTCGAGLVPCGPVGGISSFTSFTLGGAGSPVQPIPVTVGQLIQVSVTLSFS